MVLTEKKMYFDDWLDAALFSMERRGSHLTYIPHRMIYEVEWLEEEEQLEND
ncbi:hypothetical protein [Erwinia phage Pecta]|nr:hypothetical protein [Erwinia phage Pecta]